MPLFHCTGDGLLNAEPNPLAALNLKILPGSNHPVSIVTTSMFEVPLERSSTSFTLDDSSSELPSTFFLYRSRFKYTLIQNNEDIRCKKHGRRRLRTQSPLFALQGLKPNATMFFRTLEHMDVLSPRTGCSKGVWAMSMALTVAIVALIAAARQRLFTDLNQPKEPFCVTCGGYGLQKCYLCKGRGIVVWEGKLQHSDPCPMCFGTCHVKCSACYGAQMGMTK